MPRVLCSIWSVLGLKERLVKLLVEHSHLHTAGQQTSTSSQVLLDAECMLLG